MSVDVSLLPLADVSGHQFGVAVLKLFVSAAQIVSVVAFESFRASALGAYGQRVGQSTFLLTRTKTTRTGQMMQYFWCFDERER